MRNLGPVCTAELRSLGIEPERDLPSADWRDIAMRWVEAYPDRANLNALRALIGAAADTDWRAIDPAELSEARAWLAATRRAMGVERRRIKHPTPNRVAGDRNP